VTLFMTYVPETGIVLSIQRLSLHGIVPETGIVTLFMTYVPETGIERRDTFHDIRF